MHDRGPDDIDYGWFDGILRGKFNGDAHEIHASVEAINALGLAKADLEIEGGSFSLLMGEATVAGDRLGPEVANDFIGRLQRLIDASGQPQTAESTLRCTMVAGGSVSETLFGVVEGRLHPVSQSREIEDRDRRRAPRSAAGPGLGDISRGRAAALIGAFLVLFGLLAWQNGYVDRLLTSSAETLELDTGPFGMMLELDVSGSWGNYAVVVRRGSAYPTDARAVERLLAEAVSAADRAAVNAVSDGGDVWLHLRNGEDKLLGSVKLALRPLLSDPSRTVDASLPGRIGSKWIQLALDAGGR